MLISVFINSNVKFIKLKVSTREESDLFREGQPGKGINTEPLFKYLVTQPNLKKLISGKF